MKSGAMILVHSRAYSGYRAFDSDGLVLDETITQEHNAKRILRFRDTTAASKSKLAEHSFLFAAREVLFLMKVAPYYFFFR